MTEQLNWTESYIFKIKVQMIYNIMLVSTENIVIQYFDTSQNDQQNKSSYHLSYKVILLNEFCFMEGFPI